MPILIDDDTAATDLYKFVGSQFQIRNTPLPPQLVKSLSENRRKAVSGASSQATSSKNCCFEDQLSHALSGSDMPAGFLILVMTKGDHQLVGLSHAHRTATLDWQISSQLCRDYGGSSSGSESAFEKVLQSLTRRVYTEWRERTFPSDLSRAFSRLPMSLLSESYGKALRLRNSPSLIAMQSDTFSLA